MIENMAIFTFIAGVVTVLVALMVGFYLGRKTIVMNGAMVAAATSSFDPGSTEEPEGDYINDELPDYTDLDERKDTMR